MDDEMEQASVRVQCHIEYSPETEKNITSFDVALRNAVIRVIESKNFSVDVLELSSSRTSGEHRATILVRDENPQQPLRMPSAHRADDDLSSSAEKVRAVL
jgi:hypothetical protein